MTEPNQMEAAVKALLEAVSNEGRSPSTHRAIMARHRSEWPTLWRAIDAIVSANRRSPK